MSYRENYEKQEEKTRGKYEYKRKSKKKMAVKKGKINAERTKYRQNLCIKT
jgi:hypothetical protein